MVIRIAKPIAAITIKVQPYKSVTSAKIAIAVIKTYQIRAALNNPMPIFNKSILTFCLLYKLRLSREKTFARGILIRFESRACFFKNKEDSPGEIKDEESSGYTEYVEEDLGSPG